MTETDRFILLIVPGPARRGLASLGSARSGGRESLSIYLFHTLVFRALMRATQDGWSAGLGGGVAIAATTIAIAWSLGRCISGLPWLKRLLFPSDPRQFRESLANLRRG